MRILLLLFVLALLAGCERRVRVYVTAPITVVDSTKTCCDCHWPCKHRCDD